MDALRLVAAALLATGAFFSIYRMHKNEMEEGLGKIAHMLVAILLLVVVYFVIPTRHP